MRGGSEPTREDVVALRGRLPELLRARLRVLGCLALVGCAAAAPTRPARSTTVGRPPPPPARARPVKTVRAPAPPVVEPVVPTPEPLPDINAPLAPLRAFTPKEWRRIRSVQNAVRRASRRHGVAGSLVNGVIWVESKFDRRARRGRRGPRGLMQLMPRTARIVARKLRRRYRPHVVDFNIDVGTYYLSAMLEQFDEDLPLALAGYQRGPARVRAWQETGEPHPLATIRYVRRVRQAALAFCRRLPKTAKIAGAGFSCPEPAATQPGGPQRAPARAHQRSKKPGSSSAKNDSLSSKSESGSSAGRLSL